MEAKERMDLIIKNARICTMDRDRRVLERGSAAVRGDRIAVITPGDLSESYDADQVIDAEGMILLPGFTDTHIHFFQSFLKGLGADHRLIEWLNLCTLPYGRIMTRKRPLSMLPRKRTSTRRLSTGKPYITEVFFPEGSAKQN